MCDAATLAIADLVRTMASTVKLTVVECDNTARVSSALLTCDGIEERVVCGAKGARDHHALADGISAWGSCRNVGQLESLGRALTKAGRSHIAIVSASPLSASQTLRCMQLFKSLRATCLLSLAVEAPVRGEKQLQKAVFVASATHRLCERQLPKESGARTRAWLAFLTGALDGSETILTDPPVLVARRDGALDDRGAATTSETAMFSPVVLGVTEQLAELRSMVDAAVLQMESTVLDNGLHAHLVPSTPERYVLGGYSALHYVPEPPSSHSAIYELYATTPSAAPRAADAPTAPPEPIGYISFLAYGVADAALHFPSAVPNRTLHAVQVERLVVLPKYRGVGAKEALLMVCPIWCARGYPVRVKTGSERVHESFMRCPLLAYEGHREAGTTFCGRRRPMKRYARILASESGANLEAPNLEAPNLEAPNVMHAMHSAPPCPPPSSAQAIKAASAVDASTVEAADADDWRTSRGARGSAPARDGAEGARDGAEVTRGEIRGEIRVRRPTIGSRIEQQTRGVDPAAANSIVVERRIRALLNKLTPDTIERLAPEVAELLWASPNSDRAHDSAPTDDGLHLPVASVGTLHLEHALWLLFSRTAREPLYAALYVDCARRLIEHTQHAHRAPVSSTVHAAVHAAVSTALSRVLASCREDPQANAGVGQMLAEMVLRRLFDGAEAWAPLVVEAPPMQLAAFLVHAGADLHGRMGSTEKDVLHALVQRLEALIDEDDRVNGDCSPADAGRSRRAISSQQRHACAAVLALHRRGWLPSDLQAARQSPQTLAQTRDQAAKDLDLILVTRDAPPEKLRGLREGWVHWFVGHPVIHPEDATVSMFDEAKGRFVAVPFEASGIFSSQRRRTP